MAVTINERGTALARRIRDYAPCGGGCAFWWLGQHSFIVRMGSEVILIDPYLSDDPARCTPPLLAPSEIDFATCVLVTHGHGDHLDPYALTGIAANSPGARFVCPRREVARLETECAIPAGRILAATAGDRFDCGSVTVVAAPARHEFFDAGPDGYPYLGYVLRGSRATLYHAGDTIPWDGMVAWLRRWAQMDVMIVPINGRDADRYEAGCIGNLTYQEAAELAGDVGAALAVPAHYDMFQGNQEDPERFRRYLALKYPRVGCWIGAAGECVPYERTAGG